MYRTDHPTLVGVTTTDFVVTVLCIKKN